MSHVTATPHMLAAAAGDLSSVASTISAANSSAAAGTAAVDAPGGDAVSAFVSALFTAHSKAYQAAGAQAAYYHNQFVQTLRASAGAYAGTETVNASPLQKVQEFIGAASQTPAGHLIGNGAHGAVDAAQHGGTSAPLTSGATPAPVAGNHGAAGVGAAGGDGHGAAAGGPQAGNAGGGPNGVTAGDGGAGGGGGGGSAGSAASPDQGGVGVVSAGGASAAVAAPTAWAPAGPAAPFVPGAVTTPAAPAAMAAGYPVSAVLPGFGAEGVSGHAAAVGGLGEPVAPAASAPAPAPAAPPIPTTPKALHQGGPAHPGDHPSDGDRDKPAMPIPIPPLRLPSLRGLRGKLRLGLRDREEWRNELREAATSKPWGREELLGALGLRPPAN